MILRASRLFAILIGLTTLLPAQAMAEFLSPDWSTIKVKGVAEPDWIGGVSDGNYVAMCVSCASIMTLEIKTVNDDGTGERVRSGDTTAERYTEIGKANAASMGMGAEYFGTTEVSFGPAVGFVTSAKTGLGLYSVSYQLWSDGQQLLVKVAGEDQAVVERYAERAFNAAAPLTFR